jgi:methyl-accepting chemotaxis protein
LRVARDGVSRGRGSLDRFPAVTAKLGQHLQNSDDFFDMTDSPAPGISGGHRFRFGMLAKATVTMLGVGLVPLILFGAIALKQQGDRIRSDANESMRANAERMGSQVDEWVDKNLRALQTVASLPAVTTMQRDDQAKVLAAVKRAYPWMYLVFTIGPTGANIARSDDAPLVNYGDRQYFKDVMNGKEFSWETLISKTSKKPALVMAVPIKLNGAVVGVMAAGANVEDISRIVATWKAGETGIAFLVDEQGKVIAHPREEYVLSQRRMQDHPLIAAYQADDQPHLASFADNGSEALGYVHGSRFHWAIVAQQSTDELFAPQRQTLTLGLILLVGAGILVVAIAVFSSRVLVRPIVEMTHAADRMSLGDLQTPIQSTGGDELGLLAKALERLRKSMAAAIARI